MRAIISGIVAALAFAVIAALVLRGIQKPAYETYATSSTRLGDPGYNLVGKSWSGDPTTPRNGT
jgi:hypothetical protein